MKFCQNCRRSYPVADMVRLKRKSVVVLRCKLCVAKRNPAIKRKAEA
jgi:hypothetical protein